MDGRGGCCIARYAGGGYDMSTVDRIMLRFRPIAPKPAAGGEVPDKSPPRSNHQVSPRNRRGKRKYTKDGKSSSKRSVNNNRKRKGSVKETEPVPNTSSGGSVSGGETVVTLPLLPETPEGKESPARGSPSDLSDLASTKRVVEKSPIWLSFSNNDNHVSVNAGHVSVGLDRRTVVVPKPVALPESVVTVQCVTDTWDDAYGLGFTDEERVLNLAKDACPGFISDGSNSVGWTNGAYREMVGRDEAIVWLMVKEWVPITCTAFSCRVRVQPTCRKERGSLTLPCDVWKMDGGGFAWRLDVKAALSLGR